MRRKPADVCPHCNQEIRRPRIAMVPAVNTADMSEAEVYQHFKKTDRLETLKFWIANAVMSGELRAGFLAFYAAATTIKISPAAFDRQLNQLRDSWRRESNARELARLATIGTYDHKFSRWALPEEAEATEAEEIAS